MKTFKIIITFILLATLAMAEVSVDEQVKAIQNAPTKEKRVALVNEFKKRLSTLSSRERGEAISQFRSGMHSNAQQTNTQTQTKERGHINQMQQTDTMHREQNMNQHQIETKKRLQYGDGSQIHKNNQTDNTKQNKFGGR